MFEKLGPSAAKGAIRLQKGHQHGDPKKGVFSSTYISLHFYITKHPLLRRCSSCIICAFAHKVFFLHPWLRRYSSFSAFGRVETRILPKKGQASQNSGPELPNPPEPCNRWWEPNRSGHLSPGSSHLEDPQTDGDRCRRASSLPTPIVRRVRDRTRSTRKGAIRAVVYI